MLLNKPFLAGLLLCLPGLCLPVNLSEPERTALEHITADSLRGHLSFIAGDLLEGRDTPSRGLDIAAEYIAAQFRRAGLQPGSFGSYFQEAKWETVEPDLDGAEVTIDNNGTKTAIAADNLRPQTSAALTLAGLEMVKLDAAESASWTPEQVSGKVVVMAPLEPGRGGFRVMGAARAALAKLNPALVVTTFSGPQSRLRNPEDPPRYPSLGIVDSAFRKMVDEWKAGPTGARLTVKLKPSSVQPVTLRNVVGVLPGSDPVLKDTYVLVTAHYDHVGIRRGGGTGDTIYNGANDDGSGTVSVIEIASALAALPRAPRRTLVFMTYFGEEKGLLGSRWYGKHPLFPVEKTVADLNLEQLGRTDAPGGSTVGTASVTGFDYSDIGRLLHDVGASMGFKINKDANSEPFFARSDNQALADLGVPSHTIAAAYEYPDYHGLGDEWQKIDYDNMAKLDRVIAAAIIEIAGSPHKPAWNPESSAAEKYRKAAETLSTR